ncbi:hypothetical protein AB0758_22855 [Tolypothrix bouteillei VB521301_2]|uniref:hypothetical protein n=1 Tax=Tolypothrix bouteillei TaxID=1246981 RepID=UPI0038B4CA38
MIKRTVTKFLFASTAGSMIGLATIIASISSSVAAVQTLAINAPDKYSISHIVLFLQSPSGTISRVKIDNFPDGIMSYDPNKVLSQYPNTQLVAYSVKAGNNKFNETSDALPVIIDSSVQMSQLPIDKEAQKNTTVYQYTKYPTGSSTIPVVSNPTPENNTPVVSNPAPENNTPVVSNPAPENNTPVVSNPAPENNTPVVSNPAPENNTPVVSNPAPENNTPVVSNPAPETTLL